MLLGINETIAGGGAIPVCEAEKTNRISFMFEVGSSRSEEVLLIDLRHIRNHQQVADISHNWFAGNIKSAIEVRLDSGTRVTVTGNHVRPALSEFRAVKNALELYGPHESGKPPPPDSGR